RSQIRPRRAYSSGLESLRHVVDSVEYDRRSLLVDLDELRFLLAVWCLAAESRYRLLVCGCPRVHCCTSSSSVFSSSSGLDNLGVWGLVCSFSFSTSRERARDASGLLATSLRNPAVSSFSSVALETFRDSWKDTRRTSARTWRLLAAYNIHRPWRTA